jgi:hypothetical protein
MGFKYVQEFVHPVVLITVGPLAFGSTVSHHVLAVNQLPVLGSPMIMSAHLARLIKTKSEGRNVATSSYA